MSDFMPHPFCLAMNYTKEILDVLGIASARLTATSEVGSQGIMHGIRFKALQLEVGLTESELRRAEDSSGFRFPPDLRELLAEVLPLDPPGLERLRFPNWRDIPNDYVKWRMEWPFEMLIWDVERNQHRLPGWTREPRPDENLRAMTQASLNAAPHLIPVFSHRFLPATPCERGNPIFSMHGTDTIIYGTDLLAYFCNEFRVADPRDEEPVLKDIPFWGPLATGN